MKKQKQKQKQHKYKSIMILKCIINYKIKR